MKLKKLLGLDKNRSGVKKVQVENYSLIASADHTIERNLKQFKYYSRNVARIAKYMEGKYPSFNIIDIGANIGDTVALFRSANVQQHIYAIEGEPAYIGLLKQNLTQFENVTLVETFLGETNHQIKGATFLNEGTARINKESDVIIEVRKLDDIVSDRNLKNIKLLKIDTDGYDFKILRGALSFIKEQKPVLFFEYDADYLEEQSEHGTNTFNALHELGYQTAMFYDNFGKFLLSTTTDNIALIAQLYNYMRKKESAFPYYDVCVFHKDDEAIANEIIAKETAFFS